MPAVNLLTKTNVGDREFANRIFELLKNHAANARKDRWYYSPHDIKKVVEAEFGFDEPALSEALTRLVRRRRLSLMLRSDNYGLWPHFVIEETGGRVKNAALPEMPV